MTACSGLIALLLLSLLCLVQSEAAASTTAVSGGASISMAQQGDAVALLRGNTQTLEVRTSRPIPIKFAGGNPCALPPEAAFLPLDHALPVSAVAASATVPAPRASANQPRAPPST